MRAGYTCAVTLALLLVNCSEGPVDRGLSRADGGSTPAADARASSGEPPIAGLGVALADLRAFLGDRGGVLVWVEGAARQPRLLDFRGDAPVVRSIAQGTGGWINPRISPDGTRVVYAQGAPSSPKAIVVQRLDGAEGTRGEGTEIGREADVGYWQADSDGERIVYAGFSSKHENGADAATYSRPLVAGSTEPAGPAEQLHHRAMDGGPNGAGSWLGQVYNNLWAYDVRAGKEYSFDRFTLLDGSPADHQSCNGSMAPDDSARLMTLVIPHDFVRVYSFDAAGDGFVETSRFLLPEGLAEWEYPEWSTDPGYFTAVLMRADRKQRLFIGKVTPGELVPELLEVTAEPTGDDIGPSYSHLYLGRGDV